MTQLAMYSRNRGTSKGFSRPEPPRSDFSSFFPAGKSFRQLAWDAYIVRLTDRIVEMTRAQ